MSGQKKETQPIRNITRQETWTRYILTGVAQKLFHTFKDFFVNALIANISILYIPGYQQFTKASIFLLGGTSNKFVNFWFKNL